MHALLDRIARTTKIVVELDKILESATELAAPNPEARDAAQSLRAAAAGARARLIDGLDEVKPRVRLASHATRTAA